MKVWSYELGSRIVRAPVTKLAVQDNLFLKAKLQHEVSHWIRYSSTTIGMLLDLVVRARVITAQHAICRLDSPQRDAVIDGTRRTSPIWTFEAGYDPTKYGGDFGLSGQFWLDLTYLKTLIIDHTELTNTGWHEGAIHTAFADAWLAGERFAGIKPHPGNDRAELAIRGNAHIEGIPSSLTTRAIWECTSVIDELLIAHGSASHDSQELTKIVNLRLQTDEYGMPWNFANSLCAGGTTPQMLLIVAHLALNPPLPFLEGEDESLDFDDFFPPRRFAKIYGVVAENMFLHEIGGLVPRDEQISQVVEVLGRSVRSASAPSDPRVHASARATASQGLEQPILGHVNYGILAGSLLRHAINLNPSSIVFPEQFPTRPLVFETLESALIEREAMFPPLIAYDDIIDVSNLLGTAGLSFYLQSTAEAAAFDSIVLGRPISQIPIVGTRLSPHSRIETVLNVLQSGCLAW